MCICLLPSYVHIKSNQNTDIPMFALWVNEWISCKRNNCMQFTVSEKPDIESVIVNRKH